jgi:hypothetical protein
VVTFITLPTSLQAILARGGDHSGQKPRCIPSSVRTRWASPLARDRHESFPPNRISFRPVPKIDRQLFVLPSAPSACGQSRRGSHRQAFRLRRGARDLLDVALSSACCAIWLGEVAECHLRLRPCSAVLLPAAQCGCSITSGSTAGSLPLRGLMLGVRTGALAAAR